MAAWTKYDSLTHCQTLDMIVCPSHDIYLVVILTASRCLETAGVALATAGTLVVRMLRDQLNLTSCTDQVRVTCVLISYTLC